MKISIIGTGYVGLVTGACFAEMGIDVTCVDIDEEKISNLRNGIIPIYEPGLEQIISKNVDSNRLHFATSIHVSIVDADVIFIAVGTPADRDGSADLQYVLKVAEDIGKIINNYILVVTKSTVPIGTSEKIRTIIRSEIQKRGVNVQFDIASNPEFLKEGDAVNDCLKPERIIIGTDSERARHILKSLYEPFILNGHPIIYMNIPSAELTKYAANAMLATRISFINDIANLCEIVGADITMVRNGIGSDSRIGNKFLYAGIGYGGACFPKDVKALISTGNQNGYKLRILQAVELVNEAQKERIYHKVSSYFDGILKDKHLAMWGLAFKPNTDDIREAPSLALIEKFIKAGAKITAYDPIAMNEVSKKIGNLIKLSTDAYECLKDTDVLILNTEWNEFRTPDWNIVSSRLKRKVVFDGRNIYDPYIIRSAGLKYFGIGR